jgi:hypothetical protein
MTADLLTLSTTAFCIGALHTILGPDHYVPFAAMAQSSRWSITKTALMTAGCGLIHVAGSVVIGLIGLVFGTSVLGIKALEAYRGEVAAWMLIGFGVTYLAWGIAQGLRQVAHSHHLLDLDQDFGAEARIPSESIDASNSTLLTAVRPWLMFLIFAFGPCEALIPLFMYPAAKLSSAGVPIAIGLVVFAFTIATIGTMLASVFAIYFGLQHLKFRKLNLKSLHHYSHAFAGAAILVCGIVVKLGG